MITALTLLAEKLNSVIISVLGGEKLAPAELYETVMQERPRAQNLLS